MPLSAAVSCLSIAGSLRLAAKGNTVFVAGSWLQNSDSSAIATGAGRRFQGEHFGSDVGLMELIGS